MTGQGENALNCARGGYIAIRKHFFTKRVTKHWNRLPRDVVGSPSLEMFRGHVDVALRGMV